MTDKQKVAKDKTKQLIQKLEDGLQQMFESGDFEKYLKLCNNSAFKKYSFNNIMLIMSQNPNAEFVAGYKTWENDFKRTVKKGEKAIYILAPSPYKKKVKVLDENGDETGEEKEEDRFCFRSVPVFDISQTEGEDIPDLMKKSDIDIEDCDDFVDALSKYSKLEFTTGNTTKYDGKTGNISINPNDSDMQIISDLLYACVIKDMKQEDDKKYCQAVASGVAYIIASNYNFPIDGTDLFCRMSLWGKEKETKELKKCMTDIQKAANDMIDVLDVFLM